MKKLLILTFFLNYHIGYSQENQKVNDNVFWIEATCENGNLKAKEDFKNGNYYIYLTGLTVTFKSEEEFLKFYDNYIFETYNIRFIEKGCVITNSIKCYKETMRKLVFEKFGNDIFEKSRKEAKEKFENK